MLNLNGMNPYKHLYYKLSFGLPPKDMDVVWLAQCRSYSVADEWGDHMYSTDPELELTWHEVERRTEKGAYFVHAFDNSDQRYVPLWAKRCPYKNTIAEAITNLKFKRKRQIEILKAQLRRAKQELACCEKVLLE